MPKLLDYEVYVVELKWVKLESWHVLVEHRTLCGLDIEEADEVRDELGAEKSCENCLRLMARKTDSAEPV